MAQQPQNIRPLFMIALGLAVGVGATFFIREKFLKPPVRVHVPTTVPATQPATQPVVVAEEKPPRTYMELINRDFPRLATTQPIEGGMNMRDWGHFLINYPTYVDRRGVLWITRPDGESAQTLLPAANGRLVNLTQERVHFAHWYYSEGGDWKVALVTRAGDGGFELVEAKQRRRIGAGDDYDWSRAFSIFSEGKIVVPRSGRVSVFSPTPDGIAESISPTLTGPAAVQIQFDARGFLAWIPPEGGNAGSSGVVRFVDNQWVSLTPEQGWPANILHLIPLMDGTVLQIIAEPGDRVRLNYAALDSKPIDEQRVIRLIIDLADDDAQKRDQAFKELANYGPGLWPIAENMMDSALPEAQQRLKDLLKAKFSPLLGGMEVIDSKLRVVKRLPDGGALLFAPSGMREPRGEEDPLIINPAWIAARPGALVHLLDGELMHHLEGSKAEVTAFSGEWIVTDAATGPQRYFAGELVPLLRKKELKYSELVAVDARGRFLFREPRRGMIGGPTTAPATTRPTTRAADTDGPTLIIDPTLPDPIPRLPVWHIIVKQGTVGWTANDWPVMKSGGGWALGTKDWRPLDEKTEKVLSTPEEAPPPPEFTGGVPATAWTTNPTTQPATQPVLVSAGEKPLLLDSDGNWYFDGKTALKVITRNGRTINWPLPGAATGEDHPWLVRTSDGLLFLHNQPGRILRIRPTPDGPEPFEHEATFSRRIPNVKPTRIWLDPAGRIVIAFSGNQLAILFPQGYIPPATDKIIPAGEEGVAGDE